MSKYKIEALNKSVESKALPEIARTMFAWEDDLYIKSLSETTIVNNVSYILNLYKKYDIDILAMDEQTFKNAVAKIERSNYSPYTKVAYKQAIRNYCNWRGINADWISTRPPKKKEIPELLTKDDITTMIDSCKNERDRAIISILADSGCRIGELASIRIKDVSFDKHGAVIHINGKTGSRRVRLIFSGPYLARWLDIHPHREDPTYALFVSFSNISRHKPIDERALYQVVKRISKDTGINKRIYPHLFRHSRATELANHLTQAQMESHLGWIHGSNMSQTYIHLSGADVDNALLKMHGVEVPEDAKPKPLTSIICTRCQRVNPSNAKFCFQCGQTLDIVAALNLDEQTESLENKLSDVLESRIEELVNLRVNELLKNKA